MIYAYFHPTVTFQPLVHTVFHFFSWYPPLKSFSTYLISGREMDGETGGMWCQEKDNDQDKHNCYFLIREFGFSLTKDLMYLDNVLMAKLFSSYFPGWLPVVRIHLQAWQGYIQQISSLHIVDSNNVSIKTLLSLTKVKSSDSIPFWILTLSLIMLFQCLHLPAKFHTTAAKFLSDTVCVCFSTLVHFNQALVLFWNLKTYI